MRTALSMRASLAAALCAALSLSFGLAGCKTKGTYVHVQILPGSAEPSGILSLEVQLTLGDKSATVTLKNPDGSPLAFPADTTFEIGSGSGQLALTVIARGTGGVEIDRGTTTATVTTGAITEATLQLAGGKPDLKPGETTHPFANVKVGTVGTAETLTFKNLGFKPSGPLTTALGGAGAASFAIQSDNCNGIAVAAQGSCTVLVTFKPTAEAAAAATLTVTGAPGGSATVALTGTGTANQQILTVTLLSGGANDGAGNVTSQPTGLTCASGSCNQSFTWNTTVQLTAAPGLGSRFAGWAGACTGTTTCSVTMSQARAVTASFALLSEQLVVTVSPAAGGTVASTAPDASFNCGGNPSVCTNSYPYGTTVKLVAAPATGYALSSWGGVCSGTSTSCDVPLTSNVNFTVIFSLLPETVSVNVTGQGTVSSAPPGIASCGPTGGPACSGTFSYGQSVILTASPATGYLIGKWSVLGSPAGSDCVDGSATCTVAPVGGTTVNHAFQPSQQTLTVQVGGAGQGSVSFPDRSGTTTLCTTTNGTCKLVYDYGTTVTFGAPVNATGSQFSGWSGGVCSGSGGCQVTMTGSQTVIATFTLVPVRLFLSAAGSGSGQISYSPQVGGVGVCAAPPCTITYSYGQQVTLTAAAASGSRFAGFGNPPCAGASPCVFTLTADTGATATFFQQRTLSLTVSGTGSINYSAGGTGGSCPMGTCAGVPFDQGTSVSLSANPGVGQNFTGWTGACTGTANPCAVTMNQAASVTAAFTPIPEQVTVGVSGSGGTVASSPVGINACDRNGGASCTAQFPYGQPVSLTAFPGTGVQVSGWSVTGSATVNSGCTTGSGGAAGSTACNFTPTGVTTVALAFGPLQVPLTIAFQGPGLGNVSYTPPSGSTLLNCPTASGGCSSTYNYGAGPLQLTAAAGAGSTFGVWNGCPSASGTICTISSLTAATTVTALFYTVLQVTTAGSGSGSVTSSPAVINCGAGASACSATFSAGISMTLTAAATGASLFSGWGGDCSGTATTCTLTMNVGHNATAIFSPLRAFDVKKYVSGTVTAGAGTLTVSGGLSSTCGTSCTGVSGNAADGSTVTVVAAPAPGFLFQSWGGACSGNARTCTVTMTAAQSVQANYIPAINNLFFISSALYAGNLGSAAVYDGKCNSLATAAGINNATNTAFVAYLTDTSSSPARSMSSLLGGVTGSLLRVDGQPVAMKASDLFPAGGAPALVYPPNLDENGVTVPIGTTAMTGTSNNGTATSGQNCGNWADGAASAGGGPAWSGPLFTQYNLLGCSGAGNRIFCVEKDKSGSSTPLTKPAGSKFIYAAPYTVNPTAGIAGADSACSATKPAGMTGAPLALLATTTASAASRALVSTNLYVRPDFAVVGTGAEIATGILRSGPWVSANGTIYGNYAAWSGATSLTVVGTPASTCNDWSSTASATPAYGTSGLAEPRFFYSSSGIGCSFTSAVIYCVEQ